MDEKRLAVRSESDLHRAILAAHHVEVWEDYVVNVYSVKNKVGDCVKGEEFFPLSCFSSGTDAQRVDLHAWLGY